MKLYILFTYLSFFLSQLQVDPDLEGLRPQQSL